MSEKTGKNEALEAVSSLRQKLHKMQPILLKNGTKRRVMFEFENWRELANKKYSPSEYALYLETIFAYALYGYVPKGCEGSIADPNIKPGVEQIMSDAYYSCKERIDGFNKSREYGSEGGKNKNKNKGASDSTDGNEDKTGLPGEFPEGKNPFKKKYAKATEDLIDWYSPVRCLTVEELRSWYDRVSKNIPTAPLSGTVTAADWNDIFEYIDNNDWKIGRDHVEIFPKTIVRAVKWAWNDVRKKRQRVVAEISDGRNGQQVQSNEPGESVLKDAALAKQLAEKYGLKKNG